MGVSKQVYLYYSTVSDVILHTRTQHTQQKYSKKTASFAFGSNCRFFRLVNQTIYSMMSVLSMLAYQLL